MRKILLLTILYIGLAVSCFGNEVVDSLELKLKTEQILDDRLTIISDLIKNTIWSDIDLAKTYIDQYHQESKDGGVILEVARSYNFYGIWYRVQSDYQKSIENYLKALPIYEAEKDTNMTAMMYNNIAASHKHLKNFEETIEFFQKALDLFEQTHNQEWVTNIQYNMGLEYFDHKKYDLALTIFYQVRNDFIKTEQFEFLPNCLESIGTCLANKGDSQTALTYYHDALEYELIRDQEVTLWKSICSCYIALENFTEANKYCQMALAKTDDLPNNTTTLNIFKTTSNLYEKTNRYKDAFILSKKISSLKDSIYNFEKDEHFITMIKKLELDKKDHELLLKDAKIKQKEKQQKLYNCGIVLISLLLLGTFFFFLSQKKHNKILKEKNKIINNQLEEKGVLMKEIHHRVKNNLQIISSLLNIQSREIEDQQAVEAIDASRNRVKSMALIHQNLYQKENITSIDAKDYIEKLSKSIFNSYKINQENIHLSTVIDQLELDVDLTIPLGLIINELVTNSLKHAFPENKKGEITIQLKQIENNLELIVSDNGIGIQNDATRKDAFGLKMIQIFAKKLKATYSIENDNGSKVILLINNFNLNHI